MIQVVTLIGEVIQHNDKGNLVTKVHTFYTTASGVVVNEAYVTIRPSGKLIGPKFDNLKAGNLVYAQGRFLSNEHGSPFISPDNEAVFFMDSNFLNLLEKSASDDRDSDLFQVMLIGNLGRDAEIRYTPTGKMVSSASVATNYKYKDEKSTTWFKVQAWGEGSKLGHLKQGNRVFVVGEPNIDEQTGGPPSWEWQDQIRSNYEINVRRFVPFVSQEERESQGQQYNHEPEDIPF
jgi:single-strand DNA-binding protein